MLPVIVLALLAGLAALYAYFWVPLAPPDAAPDADPQEAFMEALAVYREVIGANDPDRLREIPDHPILHPVTGESLRMRENAANFFAATRGRALTGVSSRGNVYAALVSPREGDTVANPLLLLIWHNSNHYTRAMVKIVDARGDTLAETWLPEVSHWNILLHRLESRIEYPVPATREGYVHIYAHGIHEGEGTELLFRVPVMFAEHR
jgi:hypothetical protein